MKILAIGDIIGEPGIKKMKEVLPNLIKEQGIDFVIANGENSADGMGINKNTFGEIVCAGANVVTLGNHTWAKKDVFNILDDAKIIRPANYPANTVGKGYSTYECRNKKILVINLLGRVDMNVLTENPFLCIDEILKKEKADIIIVDFHAEATAEKIAMAYYLDGRVTVLFGTHTHVQTADEKIMEKGTAYITDIGMTGPEKSVIGMEVASSLKRFVTSLPEKYKTAEGKSNFSGAVFEINDETCRVEKITRINL